MFAQRWLSVLCVVSLWGISAATTAQIPTTPIKHLVVIFQENNSFDHYFGAYPVALNPPGDLAFHALATTPNVNGFGLARGGNELIALNPNQNGAPLTNPPPGQAQPFRLDR